MTQGTHSEGTIPPSFQLELAEQRKELQRLTDVIQAARGEVHLAMVGDGIT